MFPVVSHFLSLALWSDGKIFCHCRWISRQQKWWRDSPGVLELFLGSRGWPEFSKWYRGQVRWVGCCQLPSGRRTGWGASVLHSLCSQLALTRGVSFPSVHMNVSGLACLRSSLLAPSQSLVFALISLSVTHLHPATSRFQINPASFNTHHTPFFEVTLGSAWR